jgi:hypothetical protein
MDNPKSNDTIGNFAEVADSRVYPLNINSIIATTSVGLNKWHTRLPHTKYEECQLNDKTTLP